jgi:TatD DNase family protein
MLIDSHCHLNFPEFKDDLDDVLARAKNAGITTMLTVNTHLSEAVTLQKIADAHDNIYCSVGVHPHEAKDYANQDDLLAELLKHAQHAKVIALGETGLDFYYNNSPKDPQMECFKTHMRASLKTNLPIIIHTRDADTETIDCFSGDMSLAKRALDLGFYLSFSGIITFKTADVLRDVVKFCPMDRLLVETDSPFLAPIPHRGQRNEPAYTRKNAEKVAEVKNIDFDIICAETTKNFNDLFLTHRY